MTDIAKLNIEINSQKAVQAKTDLDQLTRSGQQAEKGMGSLSAAAKRLGVALAAAFSAYAVVNEIRKTIQAASDLEETLNKFNVVFRGMQDQADEWTKNLQKNFNMSETAARSYLASVQDMLVPMGMAREEAGQLSNKIVELSADLGSFNNMPTADVMRDIQAALSGEYEGLRKYGVMLNATKIQQAALTAGLAATKDEITESDKALTTYRLILEGSADAIGDVARSQGTYAYEMRRLTANIDDFRTKIGKELLPVLSDMLENINRWISANDELLSQKIPEYASRTAYSLSLVVDALTVVTRTFELTGKTAALIFASLDAAAWELAGVLVAGPIKALEYIIDLYNKIPALPEITSPEGLTDFADNIISSAEIANQTVAEAVKDINDLLTRPLPGNAIRDSLNEVEQASEQANKSIQGSGGLNSGIDDTKTKALATAAALKSMAEIGYMEDWINLVKSGLTTQEATLEIERQKQALRLKSQGLNQEEIAYYLELLDVTDKLTEAEKNRIAAADSKAEIGYMEDWIDLVKSGLTTQEATLEIERQKQVILYENQGLTQEEIAHYRELLDITDKLTKAEKDRDKATEDFNKKQEEARREYEREWERVYDDMHEFAADTFYDIFDGQLDSFEDFADSMLDVFKRMLANMAAEAAMTNVFKPMMNQMAGSALGPVFGLPSLYGPGSSGVGALTMLPGMGWLGATIPGTAILGSELGWGAYAARNIGVMASPGVTWGSALGMGALGGLGYSTLGSAIGLPASGYSGLTAGLGAAGMGAYGGSLAAMTGLGALAGPVGIGLGALTGGLLGSVFGGGGKKTPRIAIASGLRSDSGEKPGEINSPAGFNYNIRLHNLAPDGRAEIGNAVAQYFDSLFTALDEATKYSIKDVLSSSDFFIGVNPEDYDEDMSALLKGLSDELFRNLQKNLEVALLGQDIEQINVEFFENMRNEGELLFDTFLRFSSVVENTDNFMEEFTRRVNELGVTAEDAVAQIQLVSGTIAEMDMVIAQITGSAVIGQIDALSDTWNAYIDVMRQAQATAEQLAEAEAKRNLVVGAQITGLTATSLQSEIVGGGDISSIIEKSLTQAMAGLTAESIVEKYITPLNEAVGKAWIDTGGDIEAVLAVIQGYDLSPARDEINTFRDKIEEVFGTDVPEVIEEMEEDVRNSFEYLRTESELMIRLLEAQGKTEEAIALERQHEIEDLQRTWGAASGPLEELTRQIWNLEDATEAAAQALSKASAAMDDAANAYLSALQSELSNLQASFDSAKNTYVDFLQEAISSHQEELQVLEGRMNDAKSNYLSALQSEASEQEALANSIGSAIDSIRDFRKSLSTGTDSPLNLEQRQAELMLQQTILAGQAKAGDIDSVSELISISSEYLDVTKSLASNEFEYAREVSKTSNLMSDVESNLDAQKSVAERQAESLQNIYDSVSGTSRTAEGLAAAERAYYSAKSAFDRSSHRTEMEHLQNIIDEVTMANENAQTLAEAQAEYEAAKMALDENWYTDEIAILEEMLGSTKSIEELMEAFIHAQAAYDAAKVAAAAAQESAAQEATIQTAPGQVPFNFDEEKYIVNKTAQVNALLRSGDAETAAIVAGYGLNPSSTLSTADIENAFAQAGLTAQQHYLEYGYYEGVQPFATGGSFTVAGMSGRDNLTLPDLRVSAGEIVNISRPDVMSNVTEELTALRAEVKYLREENRAHAVAQIKSSQAIERNTDYLESWDVNGLPAEEVAA